MNKFERAYLSIINESASGGSNPLTLTAESSEVIIKLITVGSPVVDGLQYRLTENDEWIDYKIGTEITLEKAGDYVQFQNTNNKLSTSSNKYVKFVIAGKIAASGNIQSMLNYSNSCSDYCYSNMFDGCTSLTSVPELPATTLAECCYAYMFRDCTSLVKAPELPATKLADFCYDNMFHGCTNLAAAPELPATKLTDGCYFGMFRDCTSLVKAPELPATTLVPYCYRYMFSGCTSLKELPKAIENYND